MERRRRLRRSLWAVRGSERRSPAQLADRAKDYERGESTKGRARIGRTTARPVLTDVVENLAPCMPTSPNSVPWCTSEGGWGPRSLTAAAACTRSTCFQGCGSVQPRQFAAVPPQIQHPIQSQNAGQKGQGPINRVGDLGIFSGVPGRRGCAMKTCKIFIVKLTGAAADLFWKFRGVPAPAASATTSSWRWSHG